MFKEYQCVMQEGNKDCGACALLTIIKTYGGNVSLEYLKDLTRTTKDGTNAYLIISAAKEMGLNAKAVRGSIFDLDDNMFPCIAHVIINKNMGHFIVIHKLDRNKKILTVADPAVGRRLMSYTEFLEISTNQFILFTPIKKMPSLETTDKLKESIISICKNNISVLISIFVFSLLCIIINIITSYKLQFIIDNVISYGSSNNLIFIISITLLLTIIKVINNYINGDEVIKLSKETLDEKLNLNKDTITFINIARQDDKIKKIMEEKTKHLKFVISVPVILICQIALVLYFLLR